MGHFLMREGASTLLENFWSAESIAVLPTPGSPTSMAQFFVCRLNTFAMRSSSFFLPTMGVERFDSNSLAKRCQEGVSIPIPWGEKGCPPLISIVSTLTCACPTTRVDLSFAYTSLSAARKASCCFPSKSRNISAAMDFRSFKNDCTRLGISSTLRLFDFMLTQARVIIS